MPKCLQEEQINIETGKATTELLTSDEEFPLFEKDAPHLLTQN